MTSVAEFWQRYLDATKPETADMFGRNLDAFWDAVQAGGPGWPGDVVLVFDHSAALCLLKTQAGGSFWTALHQIAAETTGISIEMR